MSEDKLKGIYLSLADLADGWAESQRLKAAGKDLEEALKRIEMNKKLSEAFKVSKEKGEDGSSETA